MFRLKRLGYYLFATVLCAGVSFQFFAGAWDNTSEFWGVVYIVLYMGALTNYVLSLIYFTEFLTGKSFGEIQTWWAKLEDRPFRKCIAAMTLLIVFSALLGIPIVVGAMLPTIVG